VILVAVAVVIVIAFAFSFGSSSSSTATSKPQVQTAKPAKKDKKQQKAKQPQQSQQEQAQSQPKQKSAEHAHPNQKAVAPKKPVSSNNNKKATEEADEDERVLAFWMGKDVKALPSAIDNKQIKRKQRKENADRAAEYSFSDDGNSETEYILIKRKVNKNKKRGNNHHPRQSREDRSESLHPRKGTAKEEERESLL